jgi:hypothetical protein
MNLVKYYFVGVLLAIGALSASAFWQFQQFQSSIKNINTNLPPQILSMVPNANEQLNQIMKESQSQMEKQTQSQLQDQGKSQPPIETKKYIAPDELFSFDYPADWQETADQQIDDIDGKVIFYATKINYDGVVPLTGILTVKESSYKTNNEIIDNLKKEVQNQNGAVKFTQSELIIDSKSLPLVEMVYRVKEPTSGLEIIFAAKNIVIADKNKKYIITTLKQNTDNNNLFTQEEALILDTIKIPE